jgi:ElaB/YqjD/DUF883 family membrane-anchored ribosome-binding protein
MSKLKRVAAAAKEIAKVAGEAAGDAVESAHEAGEGVLSGAKKRVSEFSRRFLGETKDDLIPTPEELEQIKKSRKKKQNLEEYTDRSGDEPGQING